MPSIKWGRSNKFGAKRTVRDGITFHSKAEADRWSELCLLEKAGVVRNLERQVKFPLKVNGQLIATYYADFVYFEGERSITEDKKGHRTREYIMKRKLFEALYPGRKILET